MSRINPLPQLLLIGVLALALSTLCSPGVAFAGEACQQAQLWVASHRADLPQTYDELSSYPVSMRRAIFRAATPEARSQLWKTHLERYLVAHPELTAPKVRVIQQALDLVTPELFAAAEGTGPERRIVPELVALDKEIRTEFEPAEAGRIFAVLGKPDNGPNGGLIVHRDLGDGTLGIQCSCSTSSDWCSGGYSCWSANCDQTGGCGTLWGYTCDGLCAQFVQ